MSVTAVNVWTGVPLLGLWVGAQIVGSGGQTSMLAVAAVATTILLAGLACVRLLTVLGRAHDRLTGRPWRARRPAPWLRSVSGERAHQAAEDDVSMTAVDYVVVASVIICCLAFEAWFFFASGSPLGGPSAR